MTKRYNLKKIRAFLTQGFETEELRRFCYDDPDFRPVYDRLAGKSGKDEIIDQLLKYAERRRLLDKLLAETKEINPEEYAEHQPYEAENSSIPKEPRRAFGIAVALIGLAIIGLILFISNIGRGSDPTPPTVTQTEAAAITPPTPTSMPSPVPSATPVVFYTPTLTPPASPSATPTTVEVVPASPTLAPTETGAIPTGNLAIPVVFNFGAKVYLTGFDGAGINGPNPISLDAQQPMFSQDGKFIMVKATLEGVTGLYKLTASGFDPQIAIKRGSAEWPILSPDGQTVMFSESTLDYRLHRRLPSAEVDTPDKNIEEVFLNDLPVPAQNLLWSEDNWLVFQGCAAWLNELDTCGIWVTPANNLDPKLIVAGAEAKPMAVKGRVVAYMFKETGQDWDIYVIPVEGGRAVNITANDFEDGLPAISPAGNMMAYISNESGKWGLWTMSLDGQNRKHWFDIDPGRGTIDPDHWQNERMSWRR